MLPFLARRPTLWRQAEQFRAKLSSIKNGISLIGGRWYPYDSMSSMVPLDQLLHGDLQSLRDLAASDAVLDVGCGDGDLAFFLESLGCASVRAVDHPPTNYNRMAGVSVMKQALGSAIQIQAANLDHHLELLEPRYGLTFLLGVLYHLKNPYMILETLARKSRYCFLSTRIAAFTPDKKTHLSDLPVAYLLDEAEANNDSTNYWIFSETGLRRILSRSGWSVREWQVTGNASVSDPVNAAADARAFCILESRLADRSTTFRLLTGWHELEYNSWRWTERRFSFELSAAGHASASSIHPSPTLRFRFHLPPQLAALQSFVTLSATVNGVALSPQTYSGEGDHEYIRAIPSATAGAQTLQLAFELDRALRPSPLDKRELGLQVDFSGACPIELL